MKTKHALRLNQTCILIVQHTMPQRVQRRDPCRAWRTGTMAVPGACRFGQRDTGSPAATAAERGDKRIAGRKESAGSGRQTDPIYPPDTHRIPTGYPSDALRRLWLAPRYLPIISALDPRALFAVSPTSPAQKPPEPSLAASASPYSATRKLHGLPRLLQEPPRQKNRACIQAPLAYLPPLPSRKPGGTHLH